MSYLAVAAVQRNAAGWDWKPLRRVARIRREANSDSSSRLLALSSDRGVEYRPDDGGRQLPSDQTITGYWRVRPDDLVFNPMWAIGGGVAVSTLSGAVSTAYRIYEPAPSLWPRFLHYWLRSAPAIEQYRLLIRGITTFDRSITREDLEGMPIPVPPLSTQTAISDYLDAETARIDALIEKKQRMASLLRERGHAEVSRLTSSSLDSDATTPTASLWYPQVPTHWKLATVGQITRLIADGPHVSPEYTDESGIPFLSVRNVVAADWDFPSAKYISKRSFASMSRRVCPEAGDVLLTKGGTTGVARVVDIRTPFQVWVHVAVLKPRPETIDPYYLAAALNSDVGYAQSRLGTRGATNQDLALGRIAKIVIALPPLLEQRSISTRLCDSQASRESTIGALERQGDLLREHRQALITAAVTGELEISGVAA